MKAFALNSVSGQVTLYVKPNEFSLLDVAHAQLIL